jgi:hypothetical protein
MAPVDQYLMERNAEFLLARSAAPIPYPARRRSWSWDGKAMKQLSERTGLSVWGKEAGWRSLTRLSSGTRRSEAPNA